METPISIPTHSTQDQPERPTGVEQTPTQRKISVREAITHMQNMVNLNALPAEVLEAVLYKIKQLQFELSTSNILVKGLRGIVETDKLTLLSSRDGLDNAIKNTVRSIIENTQEQLVVGNKAVYYICLAIDLDDFKTINTIFAHEGGDVALQFFANLLKSVTRDRDIIIEIREGGDKNLTASTTEARVGGDEFIVVLPVVMDDKGDDINGKVLADAESVIKDKISSRLKEHKIRKNKASNYVEIVSDSADLLEGEYRIGASIVAKSVRHTIGEEPNIVEGNIIRALRLADEGLEIEKESKEDRR